MVRLGIGVLALAGAAALLHGYVTDDTFIHLRYARHLLERGEFSFNPGESTYGATSPLWIFGLALFLKLGLGPLAAAWWLGLLSGLLLLLVLERLVAARPWPEPLRLAVLAIALFDAWFLRWTCSGMETPLATALLAALLWPLGRRDGGGWPAWLAWGATAGLAGLVRPEFVILGPVALPWLLWREGGRRAPVRSRLAAIAAGWLAVLGPWLLYARHAFGRWVPETASAKSSAIALEPDAWLGTALQAFRQLGAVQGAVWVALLVLVLLRFLARQLAAPAAGAAREGDGPARDQAELALIGIVACWCLVLVGGYALKQVWLISRYLSPLGPPLALAAGALAHDLLRGIAPGRVRDAARAVALAGLLFHVATNSWLVAGPVRGHAVAFARDVRGCYLETGRWLGEHSAPDATVAALDIGAVGFGSERRVLDLMGLVSPEILELGRRLGFERMVESGAWLAVAVPDYLVDRARGEPRWRDRTVGVVRFELLRTCALEGVGLREPGPWTVAVYRLHRYDNAGAAAEAAGGE